MRRLLFTSIIIGLFVCGCFYYLYDSYKPLHTIAERNFPFLEDDLDRNSLLKAAEKQLNFLKKQQPDQTVQLGEEKVTYGWLLLSMREFIGAIKKNPDIIELNTFLKTHYQLYQAGGRSHGKRRQMLVTGYYEPLFPGSITPTKQYRYPIYRVPPNLKAVVDENGNRRIGRFDNNDEFVNYWSRSEIENNNLLFGHELAFLRDPLDAFLLHVQGSGRILLPNQQTISARFAASNGLEYNSIGKLLVDENKLELSQVTIPAIRSYLKENPDDLYRILHHNPRYIFFQSDAVNTGSGPVGSSGETLTPGRSVAIDPHALPGGTLAFLVSRKPVLAADNSSIKTWTKLSRFVFPQDSGAAIKGTGRIDLFWGSGNFAEIAANNMKEPGQLYFLIKKGFPKSQM